MSESLFGMPTPDVEAELDEARVRVLVDASVYDLEAVYAAAYTFIARCYVLVDRPSPQRFAITLASKSVPVEPEQLRALAGELANELLASAWRRTITRNNRALIESVTMQAFAGAMGPPSLDELEAFDFSDEPFDDPLGIAQSWEDKYRKKPKGAAEGEEPT
jgi:His-Xaa-Ser system protein HxsD